MPRKRKTKKSVAKVPVAADPVDITTAMGVINAPLKLCRLCEVKDGPFLNIFDPEKIISKRIQQLMPFVIAENDDLPHKICFRCSAKLEELHEFIQKCINTQKNLRITVDKESKESCVKVWKKNLDKNKIANDDICDAVIKKAMEYMKDRNVEVEHDNALATENKSDVSATPYVKISSQDTSQVDSLKRSKRGKIESPKNDNSDVIDLSNDTDAESVNERKITRSSRTNVAELLTDGLDTASKRKKSTVSARVSTPNTRFKDKGTSDEENSVDKKKIDSDSSLEAPKKGKMRHSNGFDTKDNDVSLEAQNKVQRRLSVAVDTKGNNSSLEEPKVLERRFSRRLSSAVEPKCDVEQKEEKRGGINQKEQCTSDQPKPFNIMDHVSVLKVHGVGDLYQCRLCNRNFLKREVVFTHGCAKNGVPKESVPQVLAPPQPPKASTVKYINTKQDKEGKNTTIPINTEKPIAAPIVVPEVKSKPRIGPASKVRRVSCDVSVVNAPTPTPTQSHPALQMSSPSLNGRYKLVPGPNNTYTLVGDGNDGLHNPPETITKKRKSISIDRSQQDSLLLNKKNKPNEQWLKSESNSINPQLHAQPYPVGLLQTVPRAPVVDSVVKGLDVPVFNVAAARNKSYTIVHTDNPNRLLISSKPPVTQQQNVVTQPVVNTRRAYPGKRRMSIDADSKSLFTFINVDPPQESSFVLPTQESRHRPNVLTTTRRGTVQEYACNMCTEKFTRESKLQAHIQAHYSKIDEEDLLRSEQAIRKRK